MQISHKTLDLLMVVGIFSIGIGGLMNITEGQKHDGPVITPLSAQTQAFLLSQSSDPSDQIREDAEKEAKAKYDTMLTAYQQATQEAQAEHDNQIQAETQAREAKMQADDQDMALGMASDAEMGAQQAAQNASPAYQNPKYVTAYSSGAERTYATPRYAVQENKYVMTVPGEQERYNPFSNSYQMVPAGSSPYNAFDNKYEFPR